MGFFRKKKKFNVLVLGSNGMLGKKLIESLGLMASYKRFNNIGVVTGLDYPKIDLGDKNAIARYLNESIHYDYVINCAAITDTSKIEGDLKHQSYLINALAVKWIAIACNEHGSKLIHISTDYVFSEKTISGFENKIANSYDFFHTTDSDEFPVNTYGMHKLIGELFIKNMMKPKDYTIMRVSWLYGMHNNKSFVHKFLKNCVNKLNQLDSLDDDTIVEVPCTADEFSYPTSCDELCWRIANVMKYNVHGVVNACDYPLCKNTQCNVSSISDPTLGGVYVSRYDFAKIILNEFSKVAPEFKHVKLVRKHMDANPSGMQYPKFSAMQDILSNNTRSHSINDIDESRKTHLKVFEWARPWQTAVSSFIFDNRNELKKWLFDGFKFKTNV